ncbi:MAG: TspO/MBR family protein [Anaeromyxobacteraceae bacterium]
MEPVIATWPPGPAPGPGTARRLAAAAAFAGLVTGASAIGGAASRAGSRRPWYALLRKPAAQPPRAAFGPVWTALYASMAWSAYRVWRSTRPGRGAALALWGTQLALNASWSPLFFGARRPRAALAVVGALVPAVGAYALAARRVDRGAAALVVPYLAWSAFAVYLGAGVVRANARTLARR